MWSIEGRKWLKSHKVELYENIQELPIVNWQEFQKLSMIQIGVGSTIEDFNSHFSKIHAYLANKKSDEAIVEMNNLYQGYFNMIEGVFLWSYMLCPFIKSIDGVEYVVGDLNKCKETIVELSNMGLNTGMLESVVDEVKKKLLTNCPPIFLVNMMSQER